MCSGMSGTWRSRGREGLAVSLVVAGLDECGKHIAKQLETPHLSLGLRPPQIIHGRIRLL